MPELPTTIVLLILAVLTPFLIIPLSALRLILTGNLPRSLTVLCACSAVAIWLTMGTERPIPFALQSQQFVGIITLIAALWLSSVLLGAKYLLWFDLMSAAGLTALAWYYLF